MAELVRIGSRSELPKAGEAKEFKCGDKLICVANVNDELSALENECPHRGGPLGQGIIDGERLVCPWHGWQFYPRTGEVVHSPNDKIKTFPLRVEGEEVLIEID